MTTSHSTAMSSHTSPGSLSADDFDLSSSEADDYAVMQIRNAAFDAIYKLWMKRQAEGLTQQSLAKRLQRDKGWISRALRGPANWELKTIARLARALRGEVEVGVFPLEEPIKGENFHAYRDNDFARTAFKAAFSTKEPLWSKASRNMTCLITGSDA